MKRAGRFTALLLALALCAGLTGTAFAADSSQYSDVPGWAKEYVDMMLEKKLIDPKSDTQFGALDPMTRADLVVALYRLANSPDVKGKANPFKDVKEGDPYYAAAVWAYDQKIVNGRGSADTFAPDGTAQRQEIAKIICEFAARQKGKDKLYSREDDYSSFPDASEVGNWAKEYINWAVSCDLIKGKSGKLDPTGTTTRAEVAAIICRYLDDDTGDASKDDPRNQDPTRDTELLVVSFGTSFNDNRVKTIKAIEDDLAKAFPNYDVRRGFTANIIIEHVFRRDGEQIDDVKEALDRAVKAGVKNLVVQPTHLMNGYEYGDLRNLLEKKYAGKFDSIKIGAPLLTSEDDFTKVADAMVKATAKFDDAKTAICFMGHGTEAASNAIYNKMQALIQKDHKNYFIGTVDDTETAATLDDVVKAVKDGGYEKVVLRPMMIVAGDHANNDMAGDDADSWKSTFIAAGFKAENVICEVKGLGEVQAVRDILVAHAKAAVDLKDADITSEPNPENPDNKESLADGVYNIEVESDTAMFRVTACELTVKDGKMTAKLTLGGTSYDKMYVGTKGQAEKAAEGVIDSAKDADGKVTFTVPVAELDKGLQYAAHSTKSGKWFDRTLTFDSSTAKAK